MKISAKSEYACLAVLALARQRAESSPVRIREISEAYGIPERYLVQILLQLKGAGLVASTRGATGGYRLAREAAVDLAERDSERGRRSPRRSRTRSPTRVSRSTARFWPRSGKTCVRPSARCSTGRRSLSLPSSARPREWII